MPSRGKTCPILIAAALATTTWCAPAQTQPANQSFDEYEIRLTREYLAHRFAHGTAQQEWIDAANRGPTMPSDSPEIFRRTGTSLAATLAYCVQAPSVEKMAAWLEENRRLIDEIVALPPPAGPLPVQPDFSVNDPAGGSPDTFPIKRTARLLLVKAVLADKPEVRRRSLEAFDNIVRLLVKGHTLLEVMAAHGLEDLKWNVLRWGLEENPTVYRPLIRSAEDIVEPADYYTMIREEHRRWVLYWSTQDENPWATRRLTRDERKLLDRTYLDLATRVGLIARVEQLEEFRPHVKNPVVASVFKDDMRSFLKHMLVEALYDFDQRDVTKAIAKAGVEAAVKVKTRLFRVTGHNGKLFAGYEDRRIQLWPALAVAGESTFSHLVPEKPSPISAEEIIKENLRKWRKAHP